ncbi:DUF3168 domain-containing protein [Rhodoligotrophos defluvii]|uniref:DUF3168 domain-containing protein n=1 Tax=Rhodoligotrophos defluvii TaxID=2561934 RepID=UPI0010C99F8D|nr:DUF3168 domain-containing protein [Rhodoligotrophos defluvii]
MSTVAALALQKALFSHLSANAGVTDLIGPDGIADDVEERRPFPYVTIGEIRTSDWSTQNRRGHEHHVTIHVWSRAAGRREIQTIMGAIDEALDGPLPALTGHRLINLRPVFWHALRDPDGVTYHGVVRLRAVTEPLAQDA